MASIYKKPGSTFWYLQFKDESGHWRHKSTKLRYGVQAETRRARIMCAKHTQLEMEHATRKDSDLFDAWVLTFLENRYHQSLGSLSRYRLAWATLREYLKERGVDCAQQVTYALCAAYIPWRKAGGKTFKAVRHNTALLEIKALGVIMQEAVRRGLITANPAYRLGIGREKTEGKPELTDDQISAIFDALENEPEWMQTAFTIAIYHGVRFSETNVLMSDVDLESGVIYFRKTKGDKPFAAPIHPGIRPMLERFKADGRTRTLEFPPSPSKYFHKLFKRLGIRGSFHSTRVTVASRLARDGKVSIGQAMAYINHSSELVHRAYQRWQPRDVAICHDALQMPTRENRGVPRATKERDPA